MPTTAKPFRNQRVRFKNYSPPYGEKVLFDPECPSEGVRPRGGVPSRKNGRAVRFWTSGERDAIILFEASSTILAYEERPELLRFRDGPHWYRYVPHFRVTLAKTTVYVELSAAGTPSTPRQELVAEFMRSHCAAIGVRFVELPHRTIRAASHRLGALLLVRPLFRAVSEADILRVQDAVAGGASTIDEVEAVSGVPHLRLFAMVRSGELELDRSSPVSGGSRVRRALGKGTVR